MSFADPNANSTPLSEPFRAAESWSLARRLAISYFAFSCVLILVLTGISYWALVTGLYNLDDQLLLNKFELLRTLLQATPADEVTIAKEVSENAKAPRQMHVRILTADGITTHESPGMGTELPKDVFEPWHLSGTIDSASLRGSSGRYFLALSQPVQVNQSGQMATRVIQIAADTTLNDGLMAWYRRILGTLAVFAAVGCAAAGHQIAHRGLRPLRSITHAASQINAATLQKRLSLGGLPREVHELGKTFNHMLDRLEESYTRLSQFSDNIAHELRTPINNMLLGTEVALEKSRTIEEYQSILESNVEDCHRLSQIVKKLLFLARADNPQTQIDTRPTSVFVEMSVVRDYFVVAAEEQGVKLTIECDENLFAGIDRDLFQCALGNLVTNAIAHTPRGGLVQIRAVEHDGSISVDVTDTGHGIPPDDLPHIFDRFYRGRRIAAAGRMGLGLAIVKSIVELHGGTVKIESERKRGTRASLSFPQPA